MDDLLNNFDGQFRKMKLNDECENPSVNPLENPFNIILSKKKENEERIYTNNGEEHLEDYYID